MPPTSNARILVVEDELRYMRMTRIALEANHYEVFAASTGEKALELIATEAFDLILLDVVMPGMNGYEVCRRIREFSNVPIIFLTGLNDTTDKVRGLDGGANDYLTKPFSLRELLARVRVQLRQSFPLMPEPPPVLHAGELWADFSRKRIYLRGEEVKLTRTEYAVLTLLMRHQGQVVVPEYLLERVWGAGHEDEKQLLWQVIHRLRHKIEPDPSNPVYIHTHAGVGYLFDYIGPPVTVLDDPEGLLSPLDGE